LLGPNGAGKTTSCVFLASLSRPNWVCAGSRIYTSSAGGEVRARLGVVTHLPLLYGDLSAEENLQFYGSMYGIKELNRRVQEVLEMIGLTFDVVTWCARFQAGCSSDWPSGEPYCMIRKWCYLTNRTLVSTRCLRMLDTLYGM